MDVPQSPFAALSISRAQKASMFIGAALGGARVGLTGMLVGLLIGHVIAWDYRDRHAD